MMQLLYDFLPIIIFFVAYKISGIYTATATAIIVTILQASYFWIKHHKIEKMQLTTLILIVVLGGATLILHKPIFIKWKPSVIYWVFAFTFLITQFINEKPLICHIMADKVSLPDMIWKRLNIGWVIFFALMGFLNIYVVYHYSTDTWVNFKLFGILGLTVIFILLQAVYLAKHMSEQPNT